MSQFDSQLEQLQDDPNMALIAKLGRQLQVAKIALIRARDQLIRKNGKNDGIVSVSKQIKEIDDALATIKAMDEIKREF